MAPAINIESLDGYRKGPWIADYFFETIDKKYKLWMYNVQEQTMGAYYGHLSIFNESSDLPILSSGKVWVWYAMNNTFIYAQKSDCLIFKMPVYQDEINESKYPLLLIKPNSRCFSLIDWDFTSIYYSFFEVDTNIIEARELHTKELDRVNFPRRTGEVFNLDNLVWHDLNEFGNAREIYLAK